LIIFSDYINQNVAPNKNIEKDWILTTLPVSFIFYLKLKLNLKKLRK
jgi:hypothetical protein